MIHLLDDLTKLTTNQLTDIRKAMHILNADICCTNCKQCTKEEECKTINNIADKVMHEIERRKHHIYCFATQVKDGYSILQYIADHATEKLYDIGRINNCPCLIIGNDWFNITNVYITNDIIHFELSYYDECEQH